MCDEKKTTRKKQRYMKNNNNNGRWARNRETQNTNNDILVQHLRKTKILDI